MSTQPRTLTSQRRRKKRVTNSNSILRRITGLERLLPHKLRTQTSEKLDTYTQAHDSFVFLVVADGDILCASERTFLFSLNIPYCISICLSWEFFNVLCQKELACRASYNVNAYFVHKTRVIAWKTKAPKYSSSLESRDVFDLV